MGKRISLSRVFRDHEVLTPSHMVKKKKKMLLVGGGWLGDEEKGRRREREIETVCVYSKSVLNVVDRSHDFMQNGV